MTQVLRRPGVPAGLVLAGSLLLYGLTAMRSPGWLDATLILATAWNPRPGVWVNTHNLFSLAGRAWMSMLGFLEANTALTLLSAFFGSLTVLLIYAAGRELTGNRLASAIGAAGLAVSHSLWWHATVIEVYTLNAALIALALFLVFRFFRTGRFACLAGAFFAAGLASHGGRPSSSSPRTLPARLRTPCSSSGTTPGSPAGCFPWTSARSPRRSRTRRARGPSARSSSRPAWRPGRGCSGG